MKQTRSPLYPIFLFVIINLIIFTLSRLGLAIWQADRVSAVAGWGQLFLQGLRMDIVALCYLFGVPALFTVLFHNSRIWKMILRIWLTLGSVFILFMELATPAFIETYDFRCIQPLNMRNIKTNRDWAGIFGNKRDEYR